MSSIEISFEVLRFNSNKWILMAATFDFFFDEKTQRKKEKDFEFYGVCVAYSARHENYGSEFFVWVKEEQNQRKVLKQFSSVKSRV